jgi:hypothetical protein
MIVIETIVFVMVVLLVLTFIGVLLGIVFDEVQVLFKHLKKWLWKRH